MDKTIKSVYFSNEITTIGSYLMYFCTEMSELKLPNNLLSINRGAFCGCDSMVYIAIPNGVTYIGDSAFYGADNLEEVYIPNTVLSIGNSAFCSCGKLERISIPASVTYIGDEVFTFCSKLVLNVDENNQHYKTIDGVLFSKDGTILIHYPSNKTDKSYEIPYGVKVIKSRAFSLNASLENIVIPDTVITIESYAFAVKKLTQIIIPNSVNNIESKAFWDSNKTTFYCEVEYKPSGWDDKWNYSYGNSTSDYLYLPVIWGYTE